MITGDYRELQDLAKNNLCWEHKVRLDVAWHNKKNCYVLKCGFGHYPDAIIRDLSLTEMYKAGEELPEPIKSNVEKSMRRRRMQQDKQPTAVTLGGVPATDLATGELVSPEVVKSLVNYALKYQLDPARVHVALMYGKPYITIDGYLYHANRSGKSYSIASLPLTQEEKADYLIDGADHAWLCTVTLLVSGERFTGIGIVTQEEITQEAKGKPGVKRYPIVAAKPWQMAQKRAEWQALRRAFPIGKEE